MVPSSSRQKEVVSMKIYFFLSSYLTKKDGVEIFEVAYFASYFSLNLSCLCKTLQNTFMDPLKQACCAGCRADPSRCNSTPT